jgi:hypothetical protein
MLSVCLRISPINHWMTQLIYMKLGMYIMALEPISVVYFIDPSHLSVYTYPLLLLGSGLLKVSLLLPGNSSVKKLLQILQQ